MQWHDTDLKDYCAREDSSSAKAGNSTSYDEDGRVWCGTADGRPDFEDANAGEEDDLRAIEGVDPPKEELKGAASKHVSRSIPPNVLERVELVCDLRNGCGDYGSIESDKERSQVQSCYDWNEFARRRIFWLFGSSLVVGALATTFSTSSEREQSV